MEQCSKPESCQNSQRRCSDDSDNVASAVILATNVSHFRLSYRGRNSATILVTYHLMLTSGWEGSKGSCF
jgi:hypothetical protein